MEAQVGISDLTVSSGDRELTEDTPLINTAAVTSRSRNRRATSGCKGRYCTNSNAVLLILVWSMALAILRVGLDPNLVTAVQRSLGFESFDPDARLRAIVIPSLSLYGGLAIMYLFYPLAGIVADVCFGRYKVVLCSLVTFYITFIVGGSIFGLSFLLVLPDSGGAITSFILLASICGGFSSLVLLICYVLFHANVIQFGMDQLESSSTENSILYIYWYLWIYFLGVSIARILWSGVFVYSYDNFLLSVPLLLGGFFTIFIFPISLCLMCKRRVRRWFVVEPGLQNPYKLVWKVLKFAATHNRPIQRSAFTYCEDELPSRLDLGKSKYGGPFETEEVENVKVFVRILYLLIALAPFYITEIAAYFTLSEFNHHLESDHMNVTWNDPAQLSDFLIGEGVLAPILIVVLIPLYIFFLRPYVTKYVPGMLKRIGLGMLFYLFSLICTFTVDLVGHIETGGNATCMFETDWHITYNVNITVSAHESLGMNSTVLLAQNIFNALGSLLFYTAAFEFACAQSPHQMKGLIIGAFFAVKGLSYLIAVALLLVPFHFWSISNSFPSCGFAYYLINLMIGLLGLVAYSVVAKGYGYRQRDEPSNVRQFVENYYEKTEDEPGYDYDIDFTQHSIHTID